MTLPRPVAPAELAPPVFLVGFESPLVRVGVGQRESLPDNVIALLQISAPSV
jgi:hypothetical protein